MSNSVIASAGGPGDDLPRSSLSAARVDAGAVLGFLRDVEAAGLELHSLVIWRDGAIAIEGWRWPYSSDRMRMTHSQTKSIIACAIGMLIEEGRLALDDRVARFFPEYAIDPESRAGRMTVEHLLTMRSGQAHEVSGSIWRGIKSSWIEEFFRIPLEFEPGTHHVYSSAASYMLSAIVTRVTGQTAHDYLTPRLFEPLGIEAIRWDIGADGFNPGGNGITMSTIDMMKIGILHLQKGEWRGRRILPAWWVEQATRPLGAPDYGYHWVIGDTYYAALGQFVQITAIYPESDAVIALNAAMPDSKVLLPHLRRYFPAAFGKIGQSSEEAALRACFEAWAAEPTFRSTTELRDAGMDGAWQVEPNMVGIEAFTIDFTPGALRLSLRDQDGSYAVTAALDGWMEARTTLLGASLHHGYALENTPVLAGARWIGADRLEIVLHFVETAFRDTITIRREGDRLTLDRSVNINSGARAWPTLIARRA